MKDDLGYPIAGWEELLDRANTAESLVRELARARDARQKTVGDWCIRCFGEAESLHIPQRGMRMLEEALEVAQSCGVTCHQASQLASYVFSRPIGELQQELGGLGLTMLALAHAAGLSAEDAEKAEVQRVLDKPEAHFSARNAAKNEAGFLDDRISKGSDD